MSRALFRINLRLRKYIWGNHASCLSGGGLRGVIETMSYKEMEEISYTIVPAALGVEPNTGFTPRLLMSDCFL